MMSIVYKLRTCDNKIVKELPNHIIFKDGNVLDILLSSSSQEILKLPFPVL